MLAGHDAILAADIGGTNIRIGVVDLKMKKKGEISKAAVWKHRIGAIGRRADARGGSQAHGHVANELIEQAADEKLKLAPFVGVGCPGLIDERGVIVSGGQNLPGNWEGEDFSLADELTHRCRNSKATSRGRHPQRCRGPGSERSARHDRRPPLGRPYHRHRPRRRPLHQAKERGEPS